MKQRRKGVRDALKYEEIAPGRFGRSSWSRHPWVDAAINKLHQLGIKTLVSVARLVKEAREDQ